MNWKQLVILILFFISNSLLAVLPDNYTFFSRIDYPTYRYPTDIAVEDVNNDGFLDIVISNEGSDSASKDSVSILINKGDGSFFQPVNYYTHEQSFALCLGDFNSDSLIDIATANFFSKDISVLFNLGNGIYSSPMNYHINYQTWDIISTNLNSDEKIDLVVASESQYLYLFYNDGTGQFIMDSLFINQNSTGLVSVDIDNDNDMDIVATSRLGNNIVAVYNNNGSYSLRYTGINGYFKNIISVDFNNDNFADIAILHYPIGIPLIFLNNGSGQLNPNYLTPINNYYTEGINSTDINSDGLTDIIILTYDPEYLQIYLNNGQNNFQFFKKYYSACQCIPQIEISDLNNDGTKDILTTNSYSKSISIFYNLGNSSFMSPVLIHDSMYVHTITSEDFDNDGDYDIAAADYFGNYVLLLENIIPQMDSFLPADSYPIGSHTDYLYSCDLNNDSLIDLVALSNMKDSMTILLNNGNNQFYLLNTHYTGVEPTSVNSSDFDNNGYQDLVITNGYYDEIYIFFNQGNAFFDDSVLYNVGNYPNSTSLIDIENDGDIDIIFSNYYDKSISILENDGNGTFTETHSYIIGNWCTDIDDGDFDNDGYMDIVVSHIYKHGVTIFKNNHNGTFTNMMTLDFGPYPVKIQVEDFDLDGQDDIITISNETTGGDYLSYYHNQGNFIFQETFNFGTTADPVFLSTNDFDNDGDHDIAICGSDCITIIKNTTITTYVEEENIPEISYKLNNIQTYPNPFSAEININFSIESRQNITIEIINVSGQKITTLLDSQLESGIHNIYWNGRDNQGNLLPNGIYFCIFKTKYTLDSELIMYIK